MKTLGIAFALLLVGTQSFAESRTCTYEEASGLIRVEAAISLGYQSPDNDTLVQAANALQSSDFVSCNVSTDQYGGEVMTITTQQHVFEVRGLSARMVK